MPGSRLSEAERLVIERGLKAGLTQGQVAVALGRSPSTISREVRRGGGPRTSRVGVRGAGRPRQYLAVRAQRMASERARRPKPCKVTGRLGAVVTALLEADWSPEQISAMLDRPGKGGGLDLPRRKESCLHRGSIPMRFASEL